MIFDNYINKKFHSGMLCAVNGVVAGDWKSPIMKIISDEPSTLINLHTSTRSSKVVQSVVHKNKMFV